VSNRMEPKASSASQPFWEATKEQKFLLPWCKDCEKPFWYPRVMCPHCLGESIEWKEASGQGSVYASAVHWKPGMPPAGDLKPPFVVSLIDLEEGVRMLSNVIGCEATDVHEGMSVKITWEKLSDGRFLPQFEPAS